VRRDRVARRRIHNALQFLKEEGLFDAIRNFRGRWSDFGTCAGAILLATKVNNPPQESLGLLDMTVLRNGYGRQLASDVFFGPSTLKQEPLEMVFIRGPIIEQVGKDIAVLPATKGKRRWWRREMCWRRHFIRN